MFDAGHGDFSWENVVNHFSVDMHGEDMAHMDHLNEMWHEQHLAGLPASSEGITFGDLKTTGKNLVGKFKEMHWAGQTAIVATAVSIGALVGYWAFQAKTEKQNKQGKDTPSPG